MSERTESVTNPSSARNANYKADIQYATKIGRMILGSIGIWPSVLEGVGKFLPNIVVVLGNLAIYFVVVPSCLFGILDTRNVVVQLKVVGIFVFCTASSMKYCALAFRRSDILKCVKLVEEDWKSVACRGDREVMLKYGRVGRNLTILCGGFMYSGGFIYHTFLPYVIGSHVDEHNRTIRPLVYVTYSGFFDHNKTPIYEIFFSVHFMCGYVIYTVTSGGCGLAAIFATHACAQIEIIMSRLMALLNGEIFEGGTSVNARLKSIVKQHHRILGFAHLIERIMQEVCLLEFVSSTILICLLEYYCIVDWEASNSVGFSAYLLMLISVTFNIFLLCYIGELLMDKSSNIGNACFMVDWYELPAKTSRNLILIMALSSNPIRISAGRMADVSLSTFGNMIKTSVAYFSFIRTVVLK